jgi:hypothetical protein
MHKLIPKCQFQIVEGVVLIDTAVCEPLLETRRLKGFSHEKVRGLISESPPVSIRITYVQRSQIFVFIICFFIICKSSLRLRFIWENSPFVLSVVTPPEPIAKGERKRSCQPLLCKEVLEFLNNLWGAGNRVVMGFVAPARQATQPSGNGSLESILRILKSLKIRAQDQVA